VRGLPEVVRARSAAQDPHGRSHRRARLPLLGVRRLLRIGLDTHRSQKAETPFGEKQKIFLRFLPTLRLVSTYIVYQELEPSQSVPDHR
jgi:hypothetical protein